MPTSFPGVVSPGSVGAGISNMVTGLGPAKVMGGRFSAPLVLKEQLRKEHEMGLDLS